MNDKIRGELKNLGPSQNVSMVVMDRTTNQVVQQHIGHNAATNSMLTGIAHYLHGDGILNQAHNTLSQYIPRFISLGTMGLVNQLEDDEGLPDGLGFVSYRTYDKENDCWVYARRSELTGEQRDFLGVIADNSFITQEQEEALRFKDYMDRIPGYGADGYDLNTNNNRTNNADGYMMAGLGPPFKMRGNVGSVLINDLPRSTAEERYCEVCGKVHICGHDDHDYEEPIFDDDFEVVNCELISDSFPRQMISYRETVPESQAELPKTIDVVFSAMISTGALSQFRRKGHKYLFITEAGLWSKPNWEISGANGLLAGYRIVSPNKDDWRIYPDHSVLMAKFYSEHMPDVGEPTDEERFLALQYARSQITEADYEQCRKNRRKIKQNIIKVGVNQVVQVIWKVQLGAIEQLFAGAYCPDCQREYIPPYIPGVDGEDIRGSSVCPLCCELDGGDLDIGRAYCPKICDVDAGDLDKSA